MNAHVILFFDFGEKRDFLSFSGQTDSNTSGIVQGIKDNPLNETGLEQSQKLGRYLTKSGFRFNQVFSSPLSRAMQTANGIISQGCTTESLEFSIQADMRRFSK